MKLLPPAISPIWLSSNLLFFPLHSYCSLVTFYHYPLPLLLPQRSAHGWGIQHQVPGLSVIFYSPWCSPHTPSLMFSTHVFLLLMGHREVINSQHSVSPSTHQRGEGLRHSQFRILLIFQPKEKYPYGLQLSHICVGEKSGERMIAILKCRYCSKVLSVGAKWQLALYTW